MPVHDWTRVEAGMFHDFHNAWITELRNALNGGVLPRDFYALSEQHAGRAIYDVLTLHTSPANGDPLEYPSLTSGGLALAEAPPKARRQLTARETYRDLRRTLAIRHISGHRLIAMIEIVSPANKDRLESVEVFVMKTGETIDMGVHVLLVDLLPPGTHEPRGMHGAIWHEFEEEPYEPPSDEPLTVASYRSVKPPTAYVEHLAVGGAIPEMPLFLPSDRYILVPLDATYQAAYRGVPAFWRDVLEGRRVANG